MQDVARKVLADAPPEFLLAGFSLGGICALEMIAQAPNRIAKLALIDTTARPDPAANAAIRRRAVVDARTKGMDGYILDAWARLVAPSNVDNAELRQAIIAMARDCGADRLEDQAEMAIHRFDSRVRLSDIRQETLVLAGAHEQICSLDAQQELADGIAGAQFQLIENAGHFAPLENPAAVAFYLRNWLPSSSA
ncbi:alpha/beta fold hydrolase [Ensifer canadensis]